MGWKGKWECANCGCKEFTLHGSGEAYRCNNCGLYKRSNSTRASNSPYSGEVLKKRRK